ncbi:MAG: TVP38/TMEM64 family protein [Clostridia bacterium]|jgi:uncharacterized membrane protein YdjX (TVP38/TMEM64 family)|nr:TVP38/TMEM64 family protein [Clostridia bacterium]
MGNKKEKVKKLLQDKELGETKHYSKRVAATVLSITSVIICVLSLIGFLWLRNNFSNADVIKSFVEEHFFMGVLIMIFICAFQVVIALVPGELVEIAAGYVFGSWLGAFICLVGTMIGSVLAILLVRRFGRRFVESLYPREKIDALPILRERKKRNVLTALLFLIPGTPKDLFTYVVGLTDMSITFYVLITSVARFPSIIMSTFGGNALGDDKLLKAVIIFIVTGVISLCGYLVYLYIQKKHGRDKDKEGDKNEKQN